MATRINQEPLLIGAQQLSATGGNVRLNQCALLMLVPSIFTAGLVQIVGGPFQNPLGAPLANGYLLFIPNQDYASSTQNAQIEGLISVKVPLDSNGYIQGTVTGNPFYLWPNNSMYPSGGSYTVHAYTSTNQDAWRNPQTVVVTTPSPWIFSTFTPGP